MYHKIIVPLDGSRLSESILPYARVLADAFDLPVDLLQVVDSETVEAFADPGRGFFLDVVEADLRRSARNYLDKVSRSLNTRSAVNCLIDVGNPAEIIVGRAERQPEALIAMSTHGRSGIKRWYLGSVADKVLHASKNPLLVVRGKDAQSHEGVARIKRLLVPLDGSPLAEAALPLAVAVAKALGAELELMRVYTALAQAYYGEGFIPDYEEMTARLRSDAEAYLKERADVLNQEGLAGVQSILREGDAAAEIIGVAKKTEDNLVVMASHGRSGVGRWVLGGTADRVIRYSEDPVLVLRPS